MAACSALPKLDDYVYVSTLGKGTSGTVKLAFHRKTGCEFAIKVIPKDKLSEELRCKVYQEIFLLQQLRHPNIIKLEEVVETDEAIFMVTEYAKGGDLFTRLVEKGKLEEKEALAMFLEVLSAVKYMHDRRVIHRDLKPHNIFLDDRGSIKLGDFGFATVYHPDRKINTFCGSPPYAAPEMFRSASYVGPEVDIWSLGVLLFVIASACVPFPGHNFEQIGRRVCKGRIQYPHYFSTELKAALQRFLMLDPSKRSSIDLLLSDPLLSQYRSMLTTSPANEGPLTMAMVAAFIADKQLRVSSQMDLTALAPENRKFRLVEKGDSGYYSPVSSASSLQLSELALGNGNDDEAYELVSSGSGILKRSRTRSE